MEKRPVDLSSRDGTIVFGILLVGIFAIGFVVLALVLVVTTATSAPHVAP
ncbi:MAG TPA: hypothetical protein VGR87_06430 [Candidatus Limnocylindria bacterium]|jgi:hypothetical protein|nr:hypothetical protein [Candidatus Limnocylindria bacterium]